MFDITSGALRVLVTVNEAGSFTAAADRLGYTQSAVSKQIKTLEDAVGAELFRRVPRGIEVTAAGRILLARSMAVLEELEAAREDLAGVRHRLAGRVRIGAFPTAATTLIPRTIRSLHHHHPGIEVDVQIASSPSQLRRLHTGRLDITVIAIGSGLPDYDLDGLRTEDLPDGPLLVAVPDDHRFPRDGRTPVAALNDERWIAGQGPAGDPQFGAWPTLVDPTIAFAIQDWPARLGFVAAGLGITTIPGLAKASVPYGVRTVVIDDPAWSGRHAVIITGQDRAAAVTAAVDTLLRQATELGAS